MPTLPYRIYDADDHDHEPDDCFTRHIESQWRARTVHVERRGARPGRMFVGDERFVILTTGPIADTLTALIADELEGLDAATTRRILRDNLAELVA